VGNFDERQWGISVSAIKVSHPAMLVMVNQLGDQRQHQLTVLNFANEQIVGAVCSEALPWPAAYQICLAARPSRQLTICTASSLKCRLTTGCRCWWKRPMTMGSTEAGQRIPMCHNELTATRLDR